jgi:hypothetical protein
MECFGKGFLKQLRRVQLNVDLDQDSASFGARQTWADLFRLLYPVWQQLNSLIECLELNLPILSQLDLVGINQYHLEAYVGIVVLPLNLLKNDVDNTPIPTNFDYFIQLKPIGQEHRRSTYAFRQALCGITLESDLFKPVTQDQVRRFLGLASKEEHWNLEEFT